MLLWVAVAGALACALAAAERLRRVFAVVHFARATSNLRDLAAAPHGSFEHELWTAWHDGGEDWHAERLDQVAFEADHLLGRWKRVPKVAARISSTVGFLSAAVLLRSAMADVGAGDAVLDAGAQPLMIAAVQMIAVALGGSALCLAFGKEADRVGRREARRIDAWIESLGAPGEPSATANEEDAAEASELFGRSDVEG